MTETAPELGKKSFSCPHCGAHAHQDWAYFVKGYYTKGDGPYVPRTDVIEVIEKDQNFQGDKKENLKIYYNKRLSKKPFFEDHSDSPGSRYTVENLYMSVCFSCKEISLWKCDEIIYPDSVIEYIPNSDLPDDLLADFEEAAAIVAKSPRGAAALLRLVIQKLCKELGEKGKNINDDIAALVEKGLDVRIQKALDIVRVIGNNSVHPGTIDIKDNRKVAAKLFNLVNLITEAMITQPKAIDRFYETLPEKARDAIDKRDKKE